MAEQQISEDGWEPCPKGTLTGLSESLKSRTRRQHVLRVSSLGAVLLVVIAATTWFADRQPNGADENRYGGITCAEVRDSLPQMMSGSADEALVARIRNHLAECPQCAELARRMEGQAMPVGFRKSVSVESALLLASDVQ